MTREEMQALVEPEGFRPLVIRLKDSSYEVPEADFVGLPPGERTPYGVV
jgi:hypothetical protein